MKGRACGPRGVVKVNGSIEETTFLSPRRDVIEGGRGEGRVGSGRSSMVF